MRSPADSGRLDALFVAALDLSGEARAAFIAKECAGEPGLEERLQELIRLAESDAVLSASMQRQTDPSAHPAAPGPPLAPGSILGRYEIREVLGSGGQGHVYCALDPSLDREVAIKALAGAFQGDPANLRRFEREARVLAALSHPNIAAIYGFERIDGAPYLVLEKIDGGTLAQRIARGPLPVREALTIAIQVAEGLAEAHGKEVVHRDLKPSNVMLSPEGRVKLVDFGLAKSTATRTRSVSSNLTTMVGAVVGTAPYMSPEQIQGDEVDARTDLWAFGCLVYEMLTGRPAFSGRTLAEVVAAVLRDEPDLAALPGATPPELRKVIERCLRKDPNHRLRSISDVRIELVDVLAGASVPMLRDSGATPAPVKSPARS
ncbi:MAG: serine/threonine protein kinase, partial [Acidobacteria bacterium]|nr:serine/threonine protein kinase [Acidobacteriota bacterium]